MDNFTFQNETKIIFGKDTELLIGEETAQYLENEKLSKNILLHYGSGSIKKSGLYDKVVDSLKKANINFIELGGVVPNPRLSLVREGIKLCRDKKIDFILAVGGGSVIDSAKAISAGTYYEGNVWKLFETMGTIENAVPIGVILTIPAAGSESSWTSVVTNQENKRKLHFRSPWIRPKFAIMNPELNFTLPDYQTSCGASDMLAHVLERYFTNTKHVNFTDELCEATMRTIIRNTPLALKDQKDYNPRAELMWASTIAHNGLLNTGREGDWSSHMIEHELSAMYDIAHGAGLAIVFPAWMKYVYKQDIQRFVQFAVKVMDVKISDLETTNNEETALKGIEALEQWFTTIKMPIKLSQANIDASKFQEMAELCTKKGPVGCFVKLEKEDVEKIYELAK
ncbi:iron-containing alcohol dehydrogenase [Candidatus Woesearchaeota archaeon]|mgnify:CR=1 FL=1|jgi:alcohol dehydrogenase|nr:iron-containing alcohol dehydrogenase [Candidatus Woesearchaeota archaeon]